MQERCYHEQDLLRNASRTQPSRSLDRSSPSPTSSSSRNHRHTHSSVHHRHRHHRQESTNASQSKKMSAGYLDRNEGGWLASSPLEELTSTHRNEAQQDIPCSSNTASPMVENGCAKDMLGAISNEDILKLTQLTNKLPVVSRKHNHIQKGDGHTKHRPCVDPEEKECINNQHHHPHSHTHLHPRHKSRHIPTDSQLCDIGLADLLSQDFMKTSSPAPTTDTSGLLTVPSCNPSTLSTDTDDSHFSWQNMNNDLGNSSNLSSSSNISSSHSQRPLHLPALTTTSSQQTTATTRSAPVLATGTKSSGAPSRSHYHPLTISTTTASPYTDPNCTPNSSHRRSWYRALMKRDKKGKATYDESSHSDFTPPMNDSADFCHSLQQVPTLVDTNSNHISKSQTNPVADTTTNTLIPPPESSLKRKKSKKQIALERLRLPSRHKRRSSPDIEKSASTTFHKATKHDGKRRLERIGSNRRHSFDNLRDLGTDPQPGAPLPSSTFSFSSSSSAAHSPNSSTPYVPVPHTTATLGNGPESFSSTGSDDSPKDIKTNFETIPVANDDNSSNYHHHSKKVFYFDYQSLPQDDKHGHPKGVKGLVKMMIDRGYGTISEKQIKPDDDDDDDDTMNSQNGNDSNEKKDDHEMDQDAIDGQEQEDSLPTIDSSKVIAGDSDGLDAKVGTRQIAEIHVNADNDIEFVKLTQMANDTSLIKGHLLNLSVSFLVPSKTGDDPSKAEDERISYMHENSDLCNAVKDRLVSLEPFLDAAQAFLVERGQQCRAFIPMEDSANDIQQLLSHQQQHQQQQRHHSSDSAKSSSAGGGMSVRFADPDTSSLPPSKASSMERPQSLASYRTRSSSLWNCVPFKEYNAYEYRQDQLKDAVSDLQRGMGELRRSMEETEAMVHGVQINMNDTKGKMDTYLKDVPENYYSELKRLEDSIEAILANRAKSRSMELLYWLLTALLTGCAFLLWAVICALKLCQTAISFPKKLIKAFNEHLAERNRVVKQAGQRIVAKGADRPVATTTAVPPPTTRRRSSRQLSTSPSNPSL